METKEVMERKVLLTEIICMLKEKPVKDLRFVYHLLLRMAELSDAYGVSPSPLHYACV